jgi:two-component system NtrC family sensor kinase
MIQEITRCSGIVKGLLDFAREDEPKKKPTDLNRVLEETLTLLVSQAAFHNIRIRQELAPDLPCVLTDASQIKQVFMNLVINASEAMPEGGDLVLSTRAANRHVEASFRDSGVGIAPENLTRIFDPFFSSKKGGHGTGLGLAVSYSIVERHGGEIEVESAPGRGATFIVRLPR